MLTFLNQVIARFLKSRQDKANRKLLAGSDLFDAPWYLRANPDVAENEIDPALHYLRFGAAEGRQPSPDFDGERYLEENIDVLESGVNPLIHYLLHGQHEGRGIFKANDPWNGIAIDPTSTNPLDLSSKTPIVSVIIPIYDRVAELEEAIESILGQTISAFELLLVTDGSPEPTMAVVNKYRKHPKVRIFEFPTASGNAVRGRNKGILEARGEFIAFLDSDDIAFPDRLEKSLVYLQQSGADVVYGAWEALIDGTRDIPDIRNGQVIQSPNATLALLEKHCVPSQSTVMLRKSALQAAGPLKRSMEYREDHELWARLAFHGAQFRALREPLVKIRLHAGNNELNFKSNDDVWFARFKQEYKRPALHPKKIVFVIPGASINGGIAVVLRHAHMLADQGHDVSIVNVGRVGNLSDWYPNVQVPVIHYVTAPRYCFDNIDMLFATGWQTANYLNAFEAKRKLYFVQSDERRFSDNPKVKKKIADTYRIDCEYLTEAKWIQAFLKDEFGQESYYVPNGLDLSVFHERAPLVSRSERLRILIEGPVVIPFKGVADAYHAVEGLDADIWLISSAGKPEPDWKLDRFFEAVHFSRMHEVYAACDIFIKMSRIEGFFGPPMEAMACGCSVVVSKVTGYEEYIEHEHNALVVEMGDIQGARKAVQRLIDDNALRQKLIENGHKTAADWTWEKSGAAMKAVVDHQS
ncbi:glycosyltransferase [Roseibium sp.]|uniref:glycosyltransferase n=1 Tax=Roseibium sp. TaxID=1936156 RepID=UPI003A96E4EA